MIRPFKEFLPVRAFLGATRQRDWLTLCFYALLLLSAGALLPLPLSGSWQQIFMRSQHLRSKRFSTWALRHFLPWMYNFANRGWMSKERLPSEVLDGKSPLPEGASSAWYNHYAPRAVTWDLRGTLLQEGGRKYFCFETRYQDQCVRSHYVTYPTPDGLLMEPLEDE